MFEEGYLCSTMSTMVEVWRNGRLVMEGVFGVPTIRDAVFYQSFCGLHGTGRNQVCFCTWRREHGVVQ